jgi:hypothetical protein
MSKLERPEWYGQAASDPLRQNMFTSQLKQQILRRIHQEERIRSKRPRRSRAIGTLATATCIVLVLAVALLWGNGFESLWPAKNAGGDPYQHHAAAYPTDLTDWDAALVEQFLAEVGRFVREIPAETASLESVVAAYEQYFTPELSRAVVQSLYVESDGTWRIPDGDGGLMFTVPDRTNNEVAIFAGEQAIVVEERYRSWMYAKTQYVITYDEKPMITDWRIVPDNPDAGRFDAAAVKNGDDIAGMKVVRTDLQQVEGFHVGTVRFQGAARLSGTLTYTVHDGGEELWLFRPDSSSLPLLPRLAHDERDAGFTFANPEAASALLGARPGSERKEWTVVVEIDDYLINYQEKEVYNSARLLNVFFPLSDG